MGLGVVDPENHGERPFAGPRRGLDGGKPRLPPFLGKIEPRDRPAPTVTPVVGHQAGPQDPVGDLLEPRIERGAHREAALVEPVFAVEPNQLPAHLLGEIVGLGYLGAVTPAHLERLGAGQFRRFGRDAVILQHPSDHPVAPGDRRLALSHGVVGVGALGQCRQVRGFGKGEFVERFVEIVERRGGHAVRAKTQINLIQIELENALLVEGAFHARGQDRLANLAAQ